MSFVTTRFGELTVSESSIITATDGLLGLEENTRFFILETGDDGPFKWMQSLDDPDVAFIVADPVEIFANYEPQITDADATELGITGEQDFGLVALLTVPGDLALMTANLLAPLVINMETRACKQVVLSDQKYTTRHRVFDTATQAHEGPA